MEHWPSSQGGGCVADRSISRLVVVEEEKPNSSSSGLTNRATDRFEVIDFCGHGTGAHGQACPAARSGRQRFRSLPPGRSATYGSGGTRWYNRPAYHAQCHVLFRHRPNWLLTTLS